MKNIETLRKIVSECQAAKVDGALVDLFTASAIVKVYDALNETNKAKFAALPVRRMASVAGRAVMNYFLILNTEAGSRVYWNRRTGWVRDAFNASAYKTLAAVRSAERSLRKALSFRNCGTFEIGAGARPVRPQ